jgi:hypothetical protein
MPVADVFRSIRESFRRDPPAGQFLDTLSEYPERFRSLYRGVQRQEVVESIDRLSPDIQKDRRALGEQSRNIGALALYITQTRDTAAMQKVADLLETNPNHVGAKTLLRLTRLNAQGHTGNHEDLLRPADYVPDGAPNLSIHGVEPHDVELRSRFLSSDYDDFLKGSNVIRDKSSGQDDLLLTAASSVVLRGNGNLHLHDAITHQIGVRHYYEAATVAAHGRAVRLPEAPSGRLRSKSSIMDKSGIDRFLAVDTDISKKFAPRPEWLDRNPAMKKILDAIEDAGVRIHFADDSCITPHFTPSEEGEAASIYITPPERMADGKREYVAVLLHEIGHATHEINNRASLHTYAASPYSTWHEEAVAQGISVRLLQSVAYADMGNHDAMINQKTIGKALNQFTAIQRNAFWSTNQWMKEVHNAVHRDILKGISALSISENPINRTEACAIRVLDSARDTLENLKLIQNVSSESPNRMPEDYRNRISHKQFDKTLNSLNALQSALSGDIGDHDRKTLADYAPKIWEAIQSVRDAIPEDEDFRAFRDAMDRDAAEFEQMVKQNQNGHSLSDHGKPLLETFVPEATLLAESSVNPLDKFLLRWEHGRDEVTKTDQLVIKVYVSSEKLLDASEQTHSPVGRFALQKVSKALKTIGNGMLHAHDTATSLAMKIPDMESSILRFAPKPLQDELRPVLTGIRAYFDMDTDTKASDAAGHEVRHGPSSESRETDRELCP